MPGFLEIYAGLGKDPFRAGIYAEWLRPSIKQYLASGDPKSLAKLPAFKKSWVPTELIATLGSAAELEPAQQNFLRILLRHNLLHQVGTWLLRLSELGQVPFEGGVSCLAKLGATPEALARSLGLRLMAVDLPADSPAHVFLKRLPEDSLQRLATGRDLDDLYKLRLVFCQDTGDRYARALELALAKGEASGKIVQFIEELLSAHPGKFAALGAAVLKSAASDRERIDLLKHLTLADPDRYGPELDQLVGKHLPGPSPWHNEKELAEWLIQHRFDTNVGPVCAYIASRLRDDPWAIKVASEYKNEVLDAAATRLGPGAVPVYEAAFATRQGEVQLRALKHWLALGAPSQRDAIVARLRDFLKTGENAAVARAARLCGEPCLEPLEGDLWPLLSHKSRPVRDAAAVTLARLGDSRLGHAAELWREKKADTRLAAVAWLRALGTPKAIEALRARLEDEEDDDVRDALLLALETTSSGPSTHDPAELKRRIKRTVSRTEDPPVRWLDLKKLPTAKLRSGAKLDAEALLYLLLRQSRVKDMRMDIEARPMFALVDRSTSGELAAAVLQAFFHSKADADDRWAMAFAAILGDDRLVPLFTHQIRDWADSMRGKLAEYAVQALALMGSDAALLAVDALSIRYRSKNKNIGKAAADAFAAAAQARGLTVEELGDLVVPWLGFEPGKPRILETPKGKIEARIGPDLKLAFCDAATRKRIAKIPDNAPAALRIEFKDIAANLKEAVKSQLLRHETLLVRQFRWPSARWSELYLQHPLLLPFAQRLVWGVYDARQRLMGTFRTLEDRSLTDAMDASVALPPDTRVGMVHPLELTSEARAVWLNHLADYSVVPPFAQIERTVVTPRPGEEHCLFNKEASGKELNALTFKGRAERLGWTRGSVCDGGGIGFYLKSFPVAGVDVFLELEGMYVGVDMYTDITLGRAFFVRHGSVKIGSYEYDEPGDEKDARLVASGAVPPIAYSEAMGDIRKIAGLADEPSKEGEA